MTKTKSRKAVERLISPIQKFIKQEASGGIVLLACMVIALIWANSQYASGYFDLWNKTILTIGVEGLLIISKPLLLWINDGLMAIFFFVVGLEIKRELLMGELRTAKKAIIPFAAALGGMILPAAIYMAFNVGKEGFSGWGIPMATDIAFALGVLALLGKRAPLSLKIFLTALAIVDDLGAVLVIAIFYTSDILWVWLGIAAVFFLILLALNVLGFRHPLLYALIGIGLWVAFLKSGVHATIAGVLLALTIPAYSKINEDEFIEQSRDLIDKFEKQSKGKALNLTQQSIIGNIEKAVEAAQSPLQRLEHSLHPYVSFIIMPIFALANAGVSLSGNVSEIITNPITLGIVLGLFIGKQAGIFSFVYIAVKSGWAELPQNVIWKQIWGVSMLAGIGFTMSLFIAGLAFSDEGLLTSAKFGILLASFISGIAGYLFLRFTKPEAKEQKEQAD
ncbi:MAG: Na+/H+ antiporter NhaA [Anaerolineales bacterium]|nr:Na+/H+ antiporter NhaA [Anaerolineales bacterium]